MALKYVVMINKDGSRIHTVVVYSMFVVSCVVVLSFCVTFVVI